MKIPNPRDSLLGKIAACTLALLFLPVIVGYLVLYLIAGLLIQFAIWLLWCTRGKDMLLVYSDSPNWKEYVESRLISRLRERAVLLNWSERHRWKSLSLASFAFSYFGGSREFNPMVVLFRPLRWARIFRFYKPLREYKRGRAEDLEKLEQKLFSALEPHM